MPKPMTFEEKPLGEGKHWRKFYDSMVLRWWHLPDRDVTLTIETISELESKVGRETKTQLLARFKGAHLPFALNATNNTTIEQMYGEDPHGWPGKRVTLYVTTTEMAGKTVNCIRIRPKRPEAKAGRGHATEADLDMSAGPPPADAPPPGALQQNPDPEEDGR